jgi:hypothetical protein
MWRKSKHILCLRIFLPISCRLRDDGKNYGREDRPQMAISYGACPLHAG